MIYKISALKGKLKVGDRVRGDISVCSKLENGAIGFITKIEHEYFYINDCWHPWSMTGQLEIIEEVINQNQNKFMDLKQKFASLFLKEPQKSFRKVSVTDGQDLLTQDGATIFLSWLLHSKHAEEFKKDVVDAMIAEQEASKK